ncbi:MAG: NADH-quinone oxidoreductase subunit L, partial [Clostridia bacterium]|nr:NADH-quinone oxidoreductase subunit L [Clostridia bacterium]
MAPTSAALVALLLPLAGTTLLAALAGRIGRRGAVAVACGATGLSFLSALAAWLGATIAGAPAPADLVLFRWATVAGTDVRAVLHLDALSLLFMLVVTGVGFLVHAYSAGYMAGDPGLVRYFAYMNLFVFAMLLLVLSGDLVPLLVGWAGVGLASFL